MDGAKDVGLNTGARMPLMVLGTFAIDQSEFVAALRTAFDAGYRHIDTAWFYDNEQYIGDALQKLYKEGKVKREDIFITTKLWCTHNNPADVRNVFLRALKKLQTDYVDSYLMHAPMALQKGEENLPSDENGKLIFDEEVHYVDTWKEVEKLYREGLARSIGISNFNEYQINKVLNEGSVVPAVNQVESHPYLTQEPLLKFCKEKGIVMTAYAALGAASRPWAADGDPCVLEDPVIKEIAKRHGKTPAQIAIRYQIQRGVPAIAKSGNTSRIQSNIQVFDFDLTAGDMSAISGLDKGYRFYALQWYGSHKYFPFKPNYSED